jgi:hypothetical protein
MGSDRTGSDRTGSDRIPSLKANKIFKNQSKGKWGLRRCKDPVLQYG